MTMPQTTEETISDTHTPANDRAKQAAENATTPTVAQMLMTFADEIERDTGRSYAPAYMREAARRLLFLSRYVG